MSDVLEDAGPGDQATLQGELLDQDHDQGDDEEMNKNLTDLLCQSHRAEVTNRLLNKWIKEETGADNQEDVKEYAVIVVVSYVDLTYSYKNRMF